MEKTNFKNFSVLPLPDLECKWKKGQQALTQGAATANEKTDYKQHGGNN